MYLARGQKHAGNSTNLSTADNFANSLQTSCYITQKASDEVSLWEQNAVSLLRMFRQRCREQQQAGKRAPQAPACHPLGSQQRQTPVAEVLGF